MDLDAGIDNNNHFYNLITLLLLLLLLQLLLMIPLVLFQSDSTVPLAESEEVELSTNSKEDIELGSAQDLSDNKKAPAEDEVDKTSVYSLYMDKDFRYYFQVLRLACFFRSISY